MKKIEDRPVIFFKGGILYTDFSEDLKGKKFKEDLLYSLSLITDMLDRSPTDFYKIDKTYRAVENLVNCEIENLKDDDLIAFYRINRNYDGEPITEEAKEIEKRQEEIL